MIDQLSTAVVVVNALIIRALTTCHPRLCYSPPVDRERRRRFTSCSVTNCRRLRFSNPDVGSKQAETDLPTLGGLLPGFRGGRAAAAGTIVRIYSGALHPRARVLAGEVRVCGQVSAFFRYCPRAALAAESR